MSSYENQEGEQFKLVSLDGNTGRPVAQKAKQAYSSYLKEDGSGDGSSLQLTEETEEEEQATPPKPVENKQPAKTAKAGTKPLHTASQSAPAKNDNGKKYSTSDDGIDLFSDRVEEVQDKIDELRSSFSTLFSNFLGTISAIFMKVASIVLKPFILLAGILAKLLTIPLNIINKAVTAIASRMGVKNKEEQAQESVEEVEEVQAEIKKSNFNEMIELNIFFTDNYKKNLYNKPKNAGFKLSKMEEDLIMGMSIEAIKECAEFTVELPAPTSGIYQGVPISRVMEEVTSEDVVIFLGFVKAFPGKYIGKAWKISETFATWLINNSPTG